MGFGERLRARRAALGLSQSEVGRRAGLQAQRVADLEAGRRGAVEMGTLKRLAQALECSTDYLVNRYCEDTEG